MPERSRPRLLQVSVGTVAGVMGAYLILYPRAKVLTLVPIIIIPFFFELPAFVFMGIWFLIQFLNAAASFGNATDIAWWAHIGGFLFGILFLRLLGRVPPTGVRGVDQKLHDVRVPRRRPRPGVRSALPGFPRGIHGLRRRRLRGLHGRGHDAWRQCLGLRVGDQRRQRRPDHRTGDGGPLSGAGRDGCKGLEALAELAEVARPK